jgi:multicomponent Na+:H+ antiporter subunit E
MEATGETLTRRKGTAVMFATLLLFWLMLMGSLSPDVLVVGVLASLVIAILYPDGLSFFTELRPTREAIVAGFLYYGFFFKELVKSNLSLALVVLSPSLPVRPGIVKVRTRLKSRLGRLLRANSITLTPGTLTVEMDGEWMYIHWVTVDSADIEAATAAIVAGFERYLEVIYG